MEAEPLIILVVNCGSSSLKFQLYRMPEAHCLVSGRVERIGEAGATLVLHNGGRKVLKVSVADPQEALGVILASLVDKGGVLTDVREIGAVGHRVVHGGEAFTGSVRINDEVIASIERMVDLAPLHNPANLTGIRAAQAALPGVPQVACFDTAFHATLPEKAYLYALPHELYEQYGIRRYGFHGTSHRYVARRAAELLGQHKYDINCITCHLGNGCSLTAVQDGQSVDTSMGLTPLEGLVMGTRSGDLDPAIVLYLARKGYSAEKLNRLCNKESGLLGLSGRSNDMRTLVRLAREGDARARLAIDVFVYRLKKYIGAYLAVLGTVDAIVFTGGIGENAPFIRAEACRGLEGLGIILNKGLNETLDGEGEISALSSPIRVLVIPTDEEAAIAVDTYGLAREGQAILR